MATVEPLFRVHITPIGGGGPLHPDGLGDTVVSVESPRCYWEMPPEVREGFEALERLLFEQHPELLADDESLVRYGDLVQYDP